MEPAVGRLGSKGDRERMCQSPEEKGFLREGAAWCLTECVWRACVWECEGVCEGMNV